MIETEDIQEDYVDKKKKHKLRRVNDTTGECVEIALEFEDAVIELLGSISNSFAMMAQGAAARVQPSGRQFNIVDPGRGD